MFSYSPNPVLFFWTFLVLVPFASAQKTVPPPDAAAPLFTDATETSGLDFTHYNGMTGKLYLPEIMGSGAALFDLENDGDLDIFLVQGKVLEPGVTPSATVFPWTKPEPPAGKLFRNDTVIDKDGKRTLKFTDITAASGIRADGYGFGAATGDINNDGFTDLYICNLENNRLFLNKGDGTFADITANSRTDDPRWSIGATFFDYDRDGRLDLLVINYAHFDLADQPKCFAPTTAKDYCGPKAFRQAGNSLFRNLGDGRFENVTAAAGLKGDFGHALGVVAADFNDDGWPDIYIANDGDPNELWLNQKNGRFENEAFLSGAAVNREGRSEAGMGVDAGDFNGDGTEDLFVTHLIEETHTLYKNTGAAVFEDITPQSRLALPDGRLTGFGTLFFDYDNDGRPDLFVANGAVKNIRIIKRPGNDAALDERFPLGQQNQLFRNTGDEKFEDVSALAGDAFKLFEVSRGAAFGDLDNDGDTDLIVVNNNGRSRLLLNQAAGENRWLGLKLIGRDGKRDALGSKVEIFPAGGGVLRRRVRTDGGYSSAHDPRVLVGLGSRTEIEKIRVTWASGLTEEWKNPAIGRYITLKEGSAKK
jgi:enediyne biosynthesis protein E4